MVPRFFSAGRLVLGLLLTIAAVAGLGFAQAAASQKQTADSAVPLATPSITLTSNLPVSGFGQTVPLLATVTTGGSAAAGSVILYDTFQGATSALGEFPLNTAGAASISQSTMAVGVHSIVACYDNSGSSTPAASCPTGVVTPPLQQTVVESTATTLVSSLNPSSTGAGITFTVTVAVSDGGGVTPDGTVAFANGENSLCTGVALNAGSATCAATAAQLIQGNNFITAAYSGDAAKQILSSSNSLVQDVQSGSSVSVASQPDPSSFGGQVNFVATISVAGAAAPTGSVAILDGGQKIGTAVLSGSTNQAGFSTAALAVGAHSITAVYGGDVNYAASPVSAAEMQSVQAVLPPPAADFSLTVTPASVALLSGKSTTVAVNLAALNGFSGTVALVCGALPAGVICSFSSASVPLTASAPQTVQLTIANLTTTAATGWPLTLGALICLFGWRRRRRSPLIFVAVALLGLSGALPIAGCGAGKVTGSAAQGSYTIQVTASGGGIAHAQNIQLQITP